MRSGQDRSSQDRSGEVRSGQVRSGQVRIGQIRSGEVRTGQVRSDQVRSELTRQQNIPQLSFTIMESKEEEGEFDRVTDSHKEGTDKPAVLVCRTGLHACLATNHTTVQCSTSTRKRR